MHLLDAKRIDDVVEMINELSISNGHFIAGLYALHNLKDSNYYRVDLHLEELWIKEFVQRQLSTLTANGAIFDDNKALEFVLYEKSHLNIKELQEGIISDAPTQSHAPL